MSPTQQAARETPARIFARLRTTLAMRSDRMNFRGNEGNHRDQNVLSDLKR
jgi:hypothetical protein